MSETDPVINYNLDVGSMSLREFEITAEYYQKSRNKIKEIQRSYDKKTSKITIKETKALMSA